MVLKEEFQAWKASEVYSEMWKSIAEKIGDLAAEIVNRDKPDGLRDQYLRGTIQGLKSVLEWTPEFPPEPEVDEEDDDEV